MYVDDIYTKSAVLLYKMVVNEQNDSINPKTNNRIHTQNTSSHVVFPVTSVEYSVLTLAPQDTVYCKLQMNGA